MTTPAADTAPPPTDERPIPLWNNAVTLTGFFTVVIGVILLMTFGLFTLITPAANPYVDIVGYLVLPTILILGLIIAPIGMAWHYRRLRRSYGEKPLRVHIARIDLSDPVQRRVVTVFAATTFIMLPVLGVSGYHGYHYTDSVEFCAKACHTVMEPQGTSHAASPHARVSCAECHIGSGAEWFVKAKISGTRQVFATFFDTFPRPIPTAITQLRPARDTCEQCHWPEKFYGAQLRQLVRYGSDETNTRHDVDMLLQIGGGDRTRGATSGIHAHMAIGTIDYVALDDELQDIPWVQWIDLEGRTRVYRSDGHPQATPAPQGERRALDCMDCHNRPAHAFRAPQEAVDVEMAIGHIPDSLPFIKREAVSALAQPYADTAAADAEIAAALSTFYATAYPEVAVRERSAVEMAIAGVQRVYRNNIFPAMKVDWRTYPDNIGHKNSAGCFRCHDGRHVDEAGVAIRSECSICHTFYNPLENGNPNSAILEGQFTHPMVLEGVHAQLLCHQCHTGGPVPPPTCVGCHADIQALYTGTAPAHLGLTLDADAMVGSVGCQDCHDIDEPHSLAAVDVLCMDCHEDEEERFTGMLDGWSQSMAAARRRAHAAVDALAARPAPQAADPAWLDHTRQVLDWLDRAGPLHNFNAAHAAYERIAREAAARP